MPEPHAFFDLKSFLSYQNVMLMIACWGLITTAKKMAPAFFDGPIGSRLLPVLPMVLCQAGVWLTVTWQPDASVGERITLGIVLGMGTANIHSILKRLGVPVNLLQKGEQAPAQDGKEDS